MNTTGFPHRSLVAARSALAGYHVAATGAAVIALGMALLAHVVVAATPSAIEATIAGLALVAGSAALAVGSVTSGGGVIASLTALGPAIAALHVRSQLHDAAHLERTIVIAGGCLVLYAAGIALGRGIRDGARLVAGLGGLGTILAVATQTGHAHLSHAKVHAFELVATIVVAGASLALASSFRGRACSRGRRR